MWSRSVEFSAQAKGRLTQWHSRRKNYDCDNERDDGIRVVFERPRRLPNDEAGGNDTDVSQSIPEHVQQYRFHVH